MIFLKCLFENNQSFSINVLLTSEVNELKRRIMKIISQLYGKSTEYSFYYKKINLDAIDSKKIRDLGILNNDFIIVKKSISTTNNGEHFEIFVRNITGQINSFKTSANDKILSIKKKVKQKLGIRTIKFIQLFFQGILLKDDTTVKDNNILSDATISMCVADRVGCDEIFVESESGKISTIDIKNADIKISKLKRLVHNKLGYEEEKMVLIYHGQELLLNELKAEDYGIKSESVVHLFLTKSKYIELEITLKVIQFQNLMIPFKCDSRCQLKDLNLYLCHLLNNPPNNYSFFYKGKFWKNEDNLEKIEITSKDILECHSKDSYLLTDIMLLLKEIKAKDTIEFCLKFQFSGSIYELKESMKKVMKIEDKKIVVYYKNIKLEDFMKLKDYNIQNGSFIVYEKIEN